MLRNKLYVYGDEGFEIPSHIHFGKEMLNKMLAYNDHIALINTDNGDVLTFKQLAQKTVDIALSLARIGVRKGDVVSLCSEKNMDFLPTVLGTFCVGAIFSPIDITYGPVPLQHRLKISKPKIMFMSSKTIALHKEAFDSVGCIEKYIVYDEKTNGSEKQDGDQNQDGRYKKDGVMTFKKFLTETADVSDFMPSPVDGWKDWALILYSSGTTGLPKGVPLTHLSILMSTDSSTNESFKYSSILITRDWFLSYGLMVTISCLRKGTTCLFSPSEDEEGFLRAIETYKVKILLSVPSAINELVKSSRPALYDVTSVETILSGSTPLMKSQIERIEKMFPKLRSVHQIYGMVDAGDVCNDLRAPLGPRHGSVGTPSHGFIIKVVDIDTRVPLGPKQRGEICLKSPTLTPGYIGIDNSDHLDCEGFYKTGDVGYYDDDGYFFVVNRIKELIKYKDKSIAPAELEAILCASDQVKEAGVASIDGALAALVVIQPDATVSPSELADYFLARISPRIPLDGGVHLVEKLPRGAGDKLDRRALLLMLQDILVNTTKKQ